jgi:hypothetical protein
MEKPDCNICQVEFFDINADDVLAIAPDQAFSLHNSI